MSLTTAHDNVAAISTAAGNAFMKTSFPNSMKLNDVHAQVPRLKENLRAYRALFPSSSPQWVGVPSLAGNTSTTLDANTEAVLKKFQSLEGLTSDGIYGQSSRNKMALRVGVSSQGYVRLADGVSHINYNDTSGGLSADATYKLDHSWFTPSTHASLISIANAYKATENKNVEYNDGSLIDASDTPEHNTHQSGKFVDVRTGGMTIANRKAFMNACQANSNCKEIRHEDNYGLSLSKFVPDASHGHIHLEFNN